MTETCPLEGPAAGQVTHFWCEAYVTDGAGAIMAMAAVGHQPSDATPEGVAMTRALRYLLGEGRQDKSGYFGAADGSRMYGHGIVTLMLTEMLGMGVDAEMDKQLHDACQKAIDLIVRSQRIKKGSNARGGWRYTPDAGDSDLSVSVWQVMALRSAKNDGLDVASATIDDAIGYAEPMVLRGLLYQLTGDPEVAATGVKIVHSGYVDLAAPATDEDVALLRTDNGVVR